MLKIGDFAILSKISINMLRHYDEIDLLKPAHIDESSGYRYYEEKQLLVANRIQSLKGMGLSLIIIKQILSEYKDSESLKHYLQIQHSQKHEDLATLNKQILKLETAIKNLEQHTSFADCDIAIKEIPKRTVISYCRQINTYSEEGLLWKELSELTKGLDLHYATPSYDIAIYHEYNQQGIVTEIQQAIVDTHSDLDNVHFKVIKPIKVASFTYQGEYSDLQTVNANIVNWIKDNGYERNGDIFNIYHISPKMELQPTNMITEVCFPIKEI